MFSKGFLGRLGKCGFWGKVSIAWAILDSKENLWAKVDSNLLKHVISDVHKVHWAVVKVFVTGLVQRLIYRSFWVVFKVSMMGIWNF